MVRAPFSSSGLAQNQQRYAKAHVLERTQIINKFIGDALPEANGYDKRNGSDRNFNTRGTRVTPPPVRIVPRASLINSCLVALMAGSSSVRECYPLSRVFNLRRLSTLSRAFNSCRPALPRKEFLRSESRFNPNYQFNY